MQLSLVFVTMKASEKTSKINVEHYEQKNLAAKSHGWLSKSDGKFQNLMVN